MKHRILVIDDDRSVRELLAMHLEDRGCRVACAGNAADGERLAREAPPDAVILDVNLPDRSGLELLEGLHVATDAPVLVITGSHLMAPPILAMKGGAFDFIRKPIDLDHFDRALDRALEERRVSRELYQAAPEAGRAADAPAVPELIGTGPAMQQIFKEVGKLSASRATVLVLGESGTGKDLVASVIHQYSSPTRPFVPVNCAAIVETLLESELFGHERGAFTGAVAARPGKCELAGDGTLFLDEIGELSLNLQAKLLRLLQEREFERVGGVRRLPLHARVVAATNRNLAAAVRAGRFREDLHQRLKVVTIELPPLRERREDIPPLVEHLLGRINARYERRVFKVPREVMAHLCERPWFGNVRELENALVRAVIMAPGDVLLHELLPPPESPESAARGEADGRTEHRPADGDGLPTAGGIAAAQRGEPSRPDVPSPADAWRPDAARERAARASACALGSSEPDFAREERPGDDGPLPPIPPAARPAGHADPRPADARTHAGFGGTGGPQGFAQPIAGVPGPVASGTAAYRTGTDGLSGTRAGRAESPAGRPFATLEEVERDHIARVLAYTGGHRGRTCDLLGITRPTLDRKVRKYGLHTPPRSARRPRGAS